MTSAGDPGPPPDPGPNATLRTSIAGILTGLVAVVVPLYFLLTGQHLSAEQAAALAGVAAGLTGILGNIGSLLAKRAGKTAARQVAAETKRDVQSLAAATADHVLGATGSMAAAEVVLESVGVREGTKP